MIFSKDVKFIQEIDQTIISNPFLESPVLNKGTTRAIFIGSGTVPELKDNSLCTLMAERLNLSFL